MKKHFNLILIAIGGIVFYFALYVAFAFVNADFTAINWDKEIRFSFAYLSMFFLIMFIYILYAVYSENKN